MKFKFVWKKTGKEPTFEELEEVAKECEIMYMDTDGLFANEYGEVIITDDCGNFRYVTNLFKVEF